MRKLILFLLFQLPLLNALAQELPNPKYPDLFKTIPVVQESEPEWVHQLYSTSPNYYLIENAYKSYYHTHIYSKTTHTQNFKHLSRLVFENHYLKADGSIYIPTLTEIKEKESRILDKLSNKNTNTANWNPIGPFETYSEGGVDYRASQLNVYTIDQSISNPDILFAGGETGPLFKTTDKGVNWVPLAEDIFLKAGGAIKIDPSNANIVYVSDGANRLWKTTDGGMTWNIIHELSNLKITDIAVNGSVILTAGTLGLYRSTNSGASWSRILSNKCWDIELKTDNPNTVFVAKSNPSVNRTEIWKSTDAGQTFNAKLSGWWNPVGGHATSDGGARIAVTNADANRVYVVLLGEENDANNDANYIGIYKSTDAGESWTTPYDGDNNGVPDNEPGGPYSNQHWCLSTFNPSNNGGYNQGFYNLAFDVSDTDPDKFLVGFLSLFKSEDGGTSYTKWGGYVCDNCGSGYRHPDIQEIEINGNDVWVTSDGGVDYYDVNLDYQETRIKGMSGVNFWGIDQGWNEDVITGGRYHNGNTAYFQNYGVGKFLALGGGEAPTGYVNKASNREVHFSDIYDYEIPEELTGTLKRIGSFQLYPNEHYYAYGKSELLTHPIYWNHLFLGKDHKLWKSENGGASFDLVKEFGTNENILVRGIEISRDNPNTIYTLHGTYLWKSTDAGDSWSQLTLPSTGSNAQISVNESDENEIYLSFSNGATSNYKVFVSYNGGNNWSNLTTATLNGETINNIKTQAGTDGGVYIATSENVYYRNNSHSDWQLFTNGLPLLREPLKLMPFYKEGKIRYATFNRGVYESDFFENSTPIAEPMVKTKEYHCSSREIQFEDFSTLKHDGATWQWDFPEASTVSSTSVRNPIVTYDVQGSYDVTLTVTNADGISDTKTIDDMIVIGEDYCHPEPDPQNALHCNATLDYNDVTHFSFTAWVKPEGIQADYSGIFSLGVGEGTNVNVLNFREGNNTLGFHWNGTHWNLDSNLVVPADQWSYIAITVSPTQIKLFVNEESKVWNLTSIPVEINRILLGTYYEWGGRNYKGLIDEATFWKRTLSDEEIRLARHLSKQDMSDADMMAYYQFNHNDGSLVYDKKNSYDLSLSNNADLQVSTAPFGIGVSQLLEVSSPGIKDFTEAHLAIDFASGVLPDGEVVVSKIDLLPNNTPSVFSIDNAYWIVNNYGQNTNFSALNKITFSEVGDIDTAVPSVLKLYKRGSNSDTEAEWNEVATALSLDSSTETVEFPGSTITSFSQFYLGSTVHLSNAEKPLETTLAKVYPNPVVSSGKLHIETKEEALHFVLFDQKGNEVFKTKIDSDQSIETQKLSKGIYYYIIETTNKMYSGKLLVE